MTANAVTSAAKRKAKAAVASTEKAFSSQRRATVSTCSASMPTTNDFTVLLFIFPPNLERSHPRLYRTVGKVKPVNEIDRAQHDEPDRGQIGHEIDQARGRDSERRNLSSPGYGASNREGPSHEEEREDRSRPELSALEWHRGLDAG